MVSGTYSKLFLSFSFLEEVKRTIFGTVGYCKASSDFILKEFECNCKGKVICNTVLHTVKSRLRLSICPDLT